MNVSKLLRLAEDAVLRWSLPRSGFDSRTVSNLLDNPDYRQFRRGPFEDPLRVSAVISAVEARSQRNRNQGKDHRQRRLLIEVTYADLNLAALALGDPAAAWDGVCQSRRAALIKPPETASN